MTACYIPDFKADLSKINTLSTIADTEFNKIFFTTGKDNKQYNISKIGVMPIFNEDTMKTTKIKKKYAMSTDDWFLYRSVPAKRKIATQTYKLFDNVEDLYKIHMIILHIHSCLNAERYRKNDIINYVSKNRNIWDLYDETTTDKETFIKEKINENQYNSYVLYSEKNDKTTNDLIKKYNKKYFIPVILRNYYETRGTFDEDKFNKYHEYTEARANAVLGHYSKLNHELINEYYSTYKPHIVEKYNNVFNDLVEEFVFQH